MTDVQLKRFESPDEVRNFTKGKFEIVRFPGATVGRATYEPGWKWSTHIGSRTGAIAKCPVDPATNKPKLPEAEKHCDSVPGATLSGGTAF